MKNQVKNGFPVRNWFKNSVIEVACEKQSSQTCNVLKPFISVWLPLIGIHLQPSPKVSTKRLKMVHSLFAFCYTLISYIFLLINAYVNKQKVAANFANDVGEKTSSTFVWTILVDYGNMAIRMVGVHFILAIRIDKSFEKLKDSLDKTELILSSMMSQQDRLLHYSKCRKLCYFSIAYILAVIILSSVAVGIEMFYENESLNRIILEANSIILFFYPVSGLILFCLLCFIISNQLRCITKLARKVPIDGENRLKELKNEHVQISTSLDLLNRSFGPILFLEISYIFIAVTVNFVYCMVATLSNRGWTIYFLTFCVLSIQITDLFLLCISADNIQKQARKLGLVLFQIGQQNHALRHEMTSFAGQVSQLDPQITGNGFFSIGKELIPSLIGVTLTYFFITYQFHSTEIGKH